MSSAPSGRYQSRLFNFIYRQSRHLKQQGDRALGHLRVTTSWLGIGLYPLYLLFQSTSSVAKQLHQAVRQLPKLSAGTTNVQTETPPIDTPIQRVLLAVDTLPSKEASLSFCLDKTESSNFLAFLASNALWGNAMALKRFKFLSNSPKNTSSLTHSYISSNRPRVQGIATQLSNRSLVLVTVQNEILDIFTRQQQQKLQKRIIGEVADYWRCQRLHSVEQELTTQVEPSDKLLLPVSLNSIIAKVRTGIIALTGNIFQKSSLVKQQLKGGEISPADSYSHRALIFLDSTVAAWESQQLALMSVAITVRQRELVKLIQTQLSKYLLGKFQPINRKLPARATLNQVNSLNTDNPHRIHSLILAAINYFFGVSGRKPRVTTTPITASLNLSSSTQAKILTFKLPASAQLVSADPDPWLTLGDLFGEPCGEASSLNNWKPLISESRVAGKKILIPSSQLNRYSLRNLLHRFQKFLPEVKQSGRGREQTATGKEGEQQLPPLPQPASSGNIGKIANHSYQDWIESKPDWIETNATAIGYVKHPLEQLLTWLDRALLWLEEMLLKVLQWLQQLWSGK